MEAVLKAVLQHDKSVGSYQRKRLADHFETPPAKRVQTEKSHSPDSSNVSWDKEAVLHDLQEHPPPPPLIGRNLLGITTYPVPMLDK